MSEQKTEESWREVGDQFRALGESLSRAFRTAWESEENRQHLQGMKSGLKAMVDQVDQAIKDASGSPEGQKVRQGGGPGGRIGPRRGRKGAPGGAAPRALRRAPDQRRAGELDRQDGGAGAWHRRAAG